MNRRNMLYIFPLFLGGLAVGYLFQLTTYTSSKFQQLHRAIANLEQQGSRKQVEFKMLLNKINKVLNTTGFVGYLTDNITQSEKETKAIEKETTINLWKQPTLLNLDPFFWVMLNESLCTPKANSSENIRILPVLIHSARSHFRERFAIRHSWGSVPIYKNWDVRLVFLIGDADMGSNTKAGQKEFDVQKKRLIDEQNEFGDIVMGSFIDTYRNLTYKHLMGYKWVLNYCPNASFVFKADDDMFIDIMRILDWRTNDLDQQHSNQPDLYCQPPNTRNVLREKGSKWHVTKEEWSDEVYPDYCPGWAYGTTVDLIRKLYSVSNDIPYFWLDDVFATGALMEVVKKKHHWKPEVKNIKGNVTFKNESYKKMCENNNMTLKRLFPTFAVLRRGEFFERDMMCLWYKTLYDKLPK